MEVLVDRFAKLKIPVVYGMSFGHVKDKFTIPFGARAELDADKQTFTLLEKSVNHNFHKVIYHKGLQEYFLCVLSDYPLLTLW
jgi:Uncharacterized proteins, homologs of microcin C7 resistance protein MccF